MKSDELSEDSSSLCSIIHQFRLQNSFRPLRVGKHSSNASEGGYIYLYIQNKIITMNNCRMKITVFMYYTDLLYYILYHYLMMLLCNMVF